VWAVRNSCMMVFANLVAKLVGTKVVHDEESTANSVTAAQMFARFPTLFEFLLGQLTTAAAASEGATRFVCPAPPCAPLLTRGCVCVSVCVGLCVAVCVDAGVV